MPIAGPAGEELVMPGMEFMMQCYEDELKHPIKNLVSGQLARSLLIQVTSMTYPLCITIVFKVLMCNAEYSHLACAIGLAHLNLTHGAASLN